MITQNGQNAVPSGDVVHVRAADHRPRADHAAERRLRVQLRPEPRLQRAVQAKQTTFPTNGGNTGPSNFAPPLPGGGNGSQVVFPAGSALHGRFLYVACNGDNSLAVIDTSTNKVISRVPVGFFPYGVSVSRDGSKVLVSNWGVEQYKFLGAPMTATAI